MATLRGFLRAPSRRGFPVGGLGFTSTGVRDGWGPRQRHWARLPARRGVRHRDCGQAERGARCSPTCGCGSLPRRCRARLRRTRGLADDGAIRDSHHRRSRRLGHHRPVDASCGRRRRAGPRAWIAGWWLVRGVGPRRERWPAALRLPGRRAYQPQGDAEEQRGAGQPTQCQSGRRRRLRCRGALLSNRDRERRRGAQRQEIIEAGRVCGHRRYRRSASPTASPPRIQLHTRRQRGIFFAGGSGRTRRWLQVGQRLQQAIQQRDHVGIVGRASCPCSASDAPARRAAPAPRASRPVSGGGSS